MAKNVDEVTTYLVREDGTLEVKDFHPRTFKKAFKGMLKKNWRNSPSKLAKSIVINPDLLTVTSGLMGCFEDYMWDQRQSVEDSIKERTQELESSMAADDKVDGASDETLTDLYETLNVYDDKIWKLEELNPAQWVKSLSDFEYIPVVDAIEQFLKQEVNESWCAFTPSLDTAEGCAVHDMRLLSTDILDALQIEFYETEGVSLPLMVGTTLTVDQANAIALEMNLNVQFEELEPLEKTKEKKPAAKKAASTKASRAKKAAAKAEPAPQDVTPVAEVIDPVAAEPAEPVAAEADVIDAQPVEKKAKTPRKKAAAAK